MSRRRVVITGLGTVNPVAHDVPAYWKALLAGKSGIGPITLLDSSAFRVHFAGEVKDFRPDAVVDAKDVRRMDRFAQFGMYAAVEAVHDSGVDFAKEDPYRCGVIIGSGIGGLTELEEQHSIYIHKGPSRIGPFVVPKMIANAASGHVSIHFGLMGPNTAIATACASAAHAIGDSLRAIQYDQADVMISGGAEAAITHMGLGGFTSARACRCATTTRRLPAGRSTRTGMASFLAKGPASSSLRSWSTPGSAARTIHAEVLGVGSTADAYHITAPHPEGLGASRAMENAIRDAHIGSTDVDYINAHGTSTELGDTAETSAIKRVSARMPTSLRCQAPRACWATCLEHRAASN